MYYISRRIRICQLYFKMGANYLKIKITLFQGCGDRIVSNRVTQIPLSLLSLIMNVNIEYLSEIIFYVLNSGAWDVLVDSSCDGCIFRPFLIRPIVLIQQVSPTFI